MKRTAKVTDDTAHVEHSLSRTPGGVHEEQALAARLPSHLGSSAPGLSHDTLLTSTLHPGWSYTRAEDVPQDAFGGNLFPPQFSSIDDVSDVFRLETRIMLRLILQAILQLWAENCATTLSGNSSQVLSSEHQPSTLPLPAAVSDSAANASDAIPSMPSDSSSTLPDGTMQTQILRYFSDRLASLLSYDQVLYPNAFHAFNATASANIRNSAGRALHYGILALATRHMFNKGELCFERISEQLSVEGAEIILERLKVISRVEEIAEEELITLLAGLLMYIMYKVCLGLVMMRERVLISRLRSAEAMSGVSKPTSLS